MRLLRHEPNSDSCRLDRESTAGRMPSPLSFLWCNMKAVFPTHIDIDTLVGRQDSDRGGKCSSYSTVQISSSGDRFLSLLRSLPPFKLRSVKNARKSVKITSFDSCFSFPEYSTLCYIAGHRMMVEIARRQLLLLCSQAVIFTLLRVMARSAVLVL